MRNKGLHMGRRTDPCQGYFDRHADQHQRAELLELAGAGADVAHGAEVESEVADIGAVGTDIGLLADHDVIDKARGLCIVHREPRHCYARHVLLQPLQKRHEIPDGKDMILHEASEIGDRNDVAVNRMVQQRRTKAAKVVIVVLRHV